MSNTLNDLTAGIGNAIKPLDGFLAAAQGTKALINGLGWQLPPGVNDIGLAALDIKSLIDKLDLALNVSVEVRDNEISMAGRYVEVLAAVGHTTASITSMVQGLSGVFTSNYLSTTNIAADFLPRLLQSVATSFLSQKYPAVYATLKLLGLIDVRSFPEDNSIFQTAHIRTEIRFDRIPKFFSADIKTLPAEIYGWGTPDFNYSLLLGNIAALMMAFHINVQLDSTDQVHEEMLLGRPLTPAEAAKPLPQVYFQIFKALGWNATETGLLLYSIRSSNPAASDGGIGLMPMIRADGEIGFDLSQEPPVRLELDFTFQLQNGLAVKLLPNAPPVFDTSFFTNKNSTGNTTRVAMKLIYGNDTDEIVFLSVSDALKLSVKKIVLSGGVAYDGGIEPFIEFGFEKGLFQVGGGEGDGFLSKILPGDGFQLEFDIKGGWAKKRGIYFTGSASLEIQLPTHIQFGPIALEALTITIKPDGSGLKVALGTDIRASLGPLTAVVQGIGLSSTFSFPDDAKGNLGILNAALGFKPPNGVGLSLDTGVVKGGGYLYFDYDKEEYAGVLELAIAKIVTVKAIGLITTKMPDGSKGFSMLIIITAEFGTGIQLGFGFVLLGVGGLLGLNRTMLLEPLASGIRTGAINSIMFPPDPVANAPRIISDLRTYFPPEEGKFLIGPMVKIGWGTPTLISLSFGLIIEIPGNVAIVGVLHMALPVEEAPVLVLNVAFVGALEFDKSRVWFFAAIFESRILFMTLEGEMGLLMDFSSNPDFVLSVGGFHPAFSPPPLPFPNPRRIHIDVLRNPAARITVENYFAVTSNTVQFGARAEMFYGVSAFNIHGSFSFDALFRFSPFSFVIEMSFSVGMDVFGAGLFSINLRLHLSGPAPWNASGTATLSIDLWLFSIDISVDFDITWGEADSSKIPAIPAIPILVAELNKVDNWRVNLPANANLLVSLRKLDTSSETLVLHPLGSILISQRAIPLGVKVDKVGNSPVSDAHNFSVLSNTTGLKSNTKQPVDKFAIAQFQEMSDADKLNRPSFQDFAAGVELQYDGSAYGSSKVVKRVVRYEVKVMDNNYKYNAFRWFKNIGTLFFHWLDGAAITQSPLSHARKVALVPTLVNERVKMGAPGFVVAGVANNKPVAAAAVFTSEAQARDYLHSEILKNPGMADEIHVIPTFEAVML